jgi:drug/metabolite transporter (DMT)-like permease
MTTTGIVADRVSVGILYYLIGVAFMGVLDASAKWLIAAYAVPQIVFFEATTSLIVASSIASAKGAPVFHSRRADLQILRGLLTIGTVYFFFHALRFFPLADLVAVVSAAPLFMTVLSIPILREKVGPFSKCAVCVGFLGALLIIRPGWGALQIATLFPLGSALCYALAAIVSRSLAPTDPPWTTLAYSDVALIVVSGTMMPFYWVDMAPTDVVLVIVMGLAGAWSVYYRVKACRYAPINILAPFDYTILLWAVVFGYVIWGEFPDLVVWLGAAAIVFSGISVIRRAGGAQ